MKTIEQGVKYVQNNNKGTRATPDVTYFTPFSNVSIVNFEHLIVCWDES